MTRDSMEKLRLDRRLLRRRGWIAPKELEAALAALPDVAAKGTTLGEADRRDGSAAEDDGSGGA